MVVPGSSRIYKPTKQNDLPEVAARGVLLPGEVQTNRRETFGTKSRIAALLLLLALGVTCLVCAGLFVHHVLWTTARTNEEQQQQQQQDYLRQLEVSRFEKDDKSSIFWNFQSGFQTVKTASRGQTTCYLFPIDNSSLNTFPASRMGQKVMKSNVYHIRSDLTLPDDDLLPLMGALAFEECRQNRVMWLAPYPVDGLEHVGGGGGEEDDDDDDDESSDNESAMRRTRQKRNIRSCRTSCCWRVCCCDVHRFIWQVAEEFNCNHVCNRCSKTYKSVVQRLC